MRCAVGNVPVPGLPKKLSGEGTLCSYPGCKKLWFILFEFKTACADQDLKGVTSCHLWKDTGLTSGQGIRCFRGKCAKSFHGGVGSRDLEAGGEWGGNEGIIFSGKSGKSSVTQILAAQARVEMRRPWSEYGETEF
jgi:hypothetical protein